MFKIEKKCESGKGKISYFFEVKLSPEQLNSLLPMEYACWLEDVRNKCAIETEEFYFENRELRAIAVHAQQESPSVKRLYWFDTSVRQWHAYVPSEG